MTLRDACGEFIDADSAPECHVYPGSSSVDSATIAAEVDSGVYTSELEDISVTVANISTGFYEATYTVPSSTSAGVFQDVWVSEVSGNTVYAVLNFRVEEPPVISIQDIAKNTLIVVIIEDTVAGTSGNTLASDEQLTFSTQYRPYYASPDLLRLECGNWVESIPDDTLSLMIHWSSIEADRITHGPVGSMLSMARVKFVIYDAALRLLLLPANVGGKKKNLGDLMISNSSDARATIKDIKDSRDEWWRVVNAGGSIVPGQGFSPEVAVKGKRDPDRRRVGRLWHNPVDFYYPVPAGNKKLRRTSQRKFKTGYVNRRPIGSNEPDDE
jgi:hypothetical protein